MITPPKEFWNLFRATPGALSCAEALAIMNLSALAPISMGFLSEKESGEFSLWLEMGTHKGKSAMAAICGANHKTRFNLLEPEFNDMSWAAKTVEDLTMASKIAGKQVGVAASTEYSTDYLADTEGLRYGFVFSDAGSHQDGLPMREVKLLEDRIVSGGIIAFHDFKSQFVEVEEAYEYLKSTGKYEEVPINWQEIIEYAEANNLEDGTNNTWHHTELKHPCFVGALRRKA